MKGYAGKVARVDLTSGTVWFDFPSEEFCRQYVGGLGFATRLLYDLTGPETDPLGSENVLIFATGPFQGANVPGSGRYVVVGKSPLTGTFGTSTAGSAWGIELKQAGFDALVVTGRSECPVYVWINDGQVELRSADKLWGQDTLETIAAVKEAVGESSCSVACIGPAGERMVGCAAIMTDGHSVAGRCGLGAVMGAKRLKAVAVKGSQTVEVADPATLTVLNKELMRKIADAARGGLHAHGTAVLVEGCEASGDLPVRYWQGSSWKEGAARIGAPAYTEKLQARAHPCRSCPIGCHRAIKVETPEGTLEGAGAEYESLGMLGSNCLVDDLVAISRANDRCNRLGLDTISAGSYVAFTMEAFERGWLTTQEIGSPAVWGDGEFLVRMIDQIGRREGFGARFAGGIRPVAEALGPEAREIVAEVRNLDLPAHDPRAYFSLALTYATSPRGACHLHGFPHGAEQGLAIPEAGLSGAPKRFTMDGKAEVSVLFQDFANSLELLVICLYMYFNGLTMSETMDAFNAVTGFGWDTRDLFLVGERVFTLQRLMNLRDGKGAGEDRLPKRLFRPSVDGGRAGHAPIDFAAGLQEYYRLRGWTEDGVPTQKKLHELGIAQDV